MCTEKTDRKMLTLSARPPGKSGISTSSVPVTTPSAGLTIRLSPVGTNRSGSRKKAMVNKCQIKNGANPIHQAQCTVTPSTACATQHGVSNKLNTTTSPNPKRASPNLPRQPHGSGPSKLTPLTGRKNFKSRWSIIRLSGCFGSSFPSLRALNRAK